MATDTIILEPQRRPGQACCKPLPGPQLSDEADIAATESFNAAGGPARMQVLHIIRQHAGAVCTCDMEGREGLPDQKTGQRTRQPTVSHHLRVLRDGGLVAYETR